MSPALKAWVAFIRSICRPSHPPLDQVSLSTSCVFRCETCFLFPNSLLLFSNECNDAISPSFHVTLRCNFHAFSKSCPLNPSQVSSPIFFPHLLHATNREVRSLSDTQQRRLDHIKVIGETVVWSGNDLTVKEFGKQITYTEKRRECTACGSRFDTYSISRPDHAIIGTWMHRLFRQELLIGWAAVLSSPNRLGSRENEKERERESFAVYPFGETLVARRRRENKQNVIFYLCSRMRQW